MKDGFIGSFNGLSLESLYRHLHIRLTGTKPYLTNEHILYCQYILFLKMYFVRTSCSGCGNIRLPPATAICLYLVFLTVPGSHDHHLPVCASPPPEPDIGFPLQHHVVSEDGRKTYFCNDPKRKNE